MYHRIAPSLTLFIVLTAISFSHANLQCYDCESVRTIAECQIARTCPNPDDLCFVRLVQRGSVSHYELGCKSQQSCHQDPQTGQFIVGRAARAANGSQCHMCCDHNNCNDNCNILSPLIFTATFILPTCEDDPNFNCELVSHTFDICSDISHAKTVCRKSCGLCDMVDGAWSAWSSWSGCDVTCGTGTLNRGRTCTNPSPVHGGLDCVGTSTETRTCNSTACPVDGRWSGWGSWGVCSRSCGIGLRTRDRTCSNPYPDALGKDCVGYNINNDVCFERPCSNGGWSAWSSWGNCSVTCDGGLRSRSRQCDNPVPSQFGHECPGDSHDYEACNVQSCQGEVVFFSVNNPTGTVLEGGVPLFSDIVSNTGNDYNESSGCFQCSVSGLYSFAVTLLADNSSITYCYISRNGQNVGYTQATSTNNLQSGSASIYVVLNATDTVCPFCGGWKSVHKSIGTSFSGALLRQFDDDVNG